MLPKPLELPLETEFNYPFDFSLYDMDEITQLIELVDRFERYHKDIKKYASQIKTDYQTYRHILSNQVEEKRIDGLLKKELGFSIFELVKSANKFA
jgi:uncharacterized protein YktA (UPF0223 family)